MQRRKSLNRALLALGCGALVAVGSVGVASAKAPDKVTICHGTASATNPYVEITVSASSFKDGHFDDGTGKSHGANNAPDFILADGASCADGPGGGVINN